MRILQYEQLNACDFKGKLLDFGGGDRAGYHSEASFDSYDSVNIDEEMKPTWLTKVGQPLPCPDHSYDIVLSMNTIEHVYDARFALQEMCRVTKPGGEFVCSVPFLHRIHAYPNDFFRPTDRWWEEALKDAGFEDIEIIPLLWGPFSTGLACSGAPGPFRKLRIHAMLLLDLAYISLGKFLKKGFINNLPFYSVGFFIRARKA